LFEEGTPCGAHLIGRAFTFWVFNEFLPYSTFGNLGIAIASGTDPYLGLTKVVRTSGHAPPDLSEGKEFGNAVLRSFNVVPSAGPQRGAINKMWFTYHCDELNGIDASRLVFWKTFSHGQTWSIAGRSAPVDTVQN